MKRGDVFILVRPGAAWEGSPGWAADFHEVNSKPLSADAHVLIHVWSVAALGYKPPTVEWEAVVLGGHVEARKKKSSHK